MGQESFKKVVYKLSKPLISDDGKVYLCSEKNFFAFESNGSVAWTLSLSYRCSPSIAPVQGESRKIYVIAEDRVLKINPLNVGSSETAVELFFGSEYERLGDIVGLAVSISSSCVLINVKNRGLFAYRLQGKLYWSVGPVLYQHGYRQGCRKNITECYFSSVPVIDHCEASIYISNNQGEIYALSTRSPHFKWIQDFSSFGSTLTMKAGNNGLLYVTEATKDLILAVDVSRGSILWQKSFGPLSMEDYAPAVDSNGWISIGSLDGYLYSFSPKGVLKKFPIVLNMDSVIQVSPVLDCSGYAIYASQTQTEGKVTRIIGDYTYISAMKPKGVIFTLINPATGIIFWSEQYPGRFSSELLTSDLQYFLLDESILLAFFAASTNGEGFLSRYWEPAAMPKLTSEVCIKLLTGYARKFQHLHRFPSFSSGNKKTILLFLIFESIILLVLAITVRFCYMFWKKKKLQNQHLGKFLDKRRSLRLQKKVFDRSITKLQQKAAEEAIANDMLEKMGNLVKQRENIERKLSTSYSLGRDEIGSHSPSLLPLSDRKTRSFSFQGAKKESITLFHTVSDTSSETSWSEWDSDTNISEDEDEIDKGKSPIEIFSSSDDEIYQEEYQSTTPSSFASTSRQVNEIEEMKPGDQEDSVDHPLQNRIRKRKSY
ncbi:protein GAMETE EXPRESSED 3 [Solanum pennellii]|uniref:Protein GAMETE EXPRESSED 3 n=1 Tax=Solanum pennellii TaxID=28526 RepID=A0ABM1V6K8_SOLPN|nr:protein GAMETE EXPRESSED 3 [Solanum pennellii]